MKKMRTLVALVAAVSAVVLVGGAAPVVSQQPAERQTITLFDSPPEEFDNFVNEGPRGLSSGDTILFVEKQLDPETCERAGRLVGRLQIVKRVGKQDAMYTGEFTMLLAGGKITAAGAARFTDFERTDPIFAVTGGTGIYKDASGEVTIAEDQERCGKTGSITTIDIGPTP